MKKFAALMMILSLSVMTVGCGGKTESASPGKSAKSPAKSPEKSPAKTPEKTPAKTPEKTS